MNIYDFLRKLKIRTLRAFTEIYEHLRTFTAMYGTFTKHYGTNTNIYGNIYEHLRTFSEIC